MGAAFSIDYTTKELKLIKHASTHDHFTCTCIANLTVAQKRANFLRDALRKKEETFRHLTPQIVQGDSRASNIASKQAST